MKNDIHFNHLYLPIRTSFLVLSWLFGCVFSTGALGAQPDTAHREAAVLARIAELGSNCDSETGFPWGKHSQPKGYHSRFDTGTKVRPTRMALEYASLLIASPKREHHEKGTAVLERVLALQDQDPQSRTFGIWSWYYEEPLDEMAAPDFNWADFQGAVLATLLHDYTDRMPASLRTQTEKALENCSRAIIKRNVGPGYTNIAMMGATVVAAAGELLKRPDFLEYGRNRIRRNLDHYHQAGGFSEYNSPSYTMIVVRELERMLYLVNDPGCREAAEELLFAAWQTIAEHYHVPTGQWSGPHSRNYGDLLSSSTRNVILKQAGILPDDVRVAPSLMIPRLPCPESLRHFFKEIPATGIERHHTFVRAPFPREENGTTWMDGVATLGSASYHTFWVQSRGFIAYWTLPDSTTPAVLKLRMLHDGKDFSSGWSRNSQSGPRVITAFGFLNNWGSMHPSFDRPKDGVFTANSFEIVYQLAAKDACGRKLTEHSYELAAGPVRAVLHLADGASFDGFPVVWEIRQEKDAVKLVGICYRGEAKKFATRMMGEIRIAAGLELLQKQEKPSVDAVFIEEVPIPDGQKEPYYGVRWKPVNGTQTMPLLVPAKPIGR